jgi:hypothetical protein
LQKIVSAMAVLVALLGVIFGVTDALELNVIAGDPESMSRALDALERRLPSERAVVRLSAGAHAVPRGGLRLGAAHSRSTWLGAGGGTSISSATALANWRPAVASEGLPSGSLVAALPAALNGSCPRLLWLGGARMRRTRRLISEVLPGVLNLTGLPHGVGYALLPPAQHPHMKWANAGAHAEMVYSGVGAASWSEARCSVAAVDAYGTIAMVQPCLYNVVHRDHQPIGAADPVYVENVKQHLSMPSEFWCDEQRRLVFFLPPADSAVALSSGAVEAMVAAEGTLLELSGTSDVRFGGISFEYATWRQPSSSGGFCEQQSAAFADWPLGSDTAALGVNDTFRVPPGNVIVRGSSGVSFDNWFSLIWDHTRRRRSAARTRSDGEAATSAIFRPAR